MSFNCFIEVFFDIFDLFLKLQSLERPEFTQSTNESSLNSNPFGKLI